MHLYTLTRSLPFNVAFGLTLYYEVTKSRHCYINNPTLSLNISKIIYHIYFIFFEIGYLNYELKLCSKIIFHFLDTLRGDWGSIFFLREFAEFQVQYPSSNKNVNKTETVSK